MKPINLIKNIIYLLLLFGISAVLMFVKMYDSDTINVFSFLILLLTVALLNGFSFIAVQKKNTFYAVSDLVCFLLWIYPLYVKVQDIFPNHTGIWLYVLILAACLPCAAVCIFILIYTLTKDKHNKKLLKAKTILSAINIAVLCAAVVLILITGIRMGILIPKEMEQRKQNYSDTINLANEIAEEYKNSDLIIDEILDKHQLTYDCPEESLYIVEEKDGVFMTINMTDNNKDEKTISVSSENIGIGILQRFNIDFYKSETQTISLT